MTLSTLLSERAKIFPRHTLIKFNQDKLTYSDINRRVDLKSGGLVNLGLKADDRAAILMENCPEYIISYFGILRAGGIAVPVNSFLTPVEISYILKDSGARILIYDSGFISQVKKIKEGMPDLNAVSFDDIPQRMSEAHEEDNDKTAVLLYTSGTTGFPKGVMLTHANLLSNAGACMKVMHLSGRDRILLFLPLFHSFSFTVCVILPIYAGASIVLLRSVKPFSGVIKSIFRDRITFFVAIPAVYNILSKKRVPLFLKYILKLLIDIKVCVSGAAALPEDTLKAFEDRFKLPLIEGYGLTEAAPVVSVNPPDGIRKPSSVGPPLPGVDVKVIGEDGGSLPAGRIGELLVRGPNVMKGYFNNSEETEAVLRDGWLYTGDMAKIDEDGYIYIVDRKKDLIVASGMNIYPVEIENVIIKHPSVEESAMVGIPYRNGEEVPVLFIKKMSDAMLDEKEIRSYMDVKIAPFKKPRRIIFVDDFPRTATGKIKKADLRKWKI
ncbi:MAG: long-chain fatty acid--CoA ligase [Nitrospirae bacterium]|nr:long-chain fatty acid--CoA ligase [Nitrospirota bacterium]